MNVVTILAGGWSASGLDLRKLPGLVIAVNDAAYYAPRWNICVSMDRVWSENRWSWIERQHGPVYLRNSTMHNLDPSRCDHVHLFKNDHTSNVLSDEPLRLDGSHSGFCALNLAYQMRPQQIYLVGLDMALGPRGEKHWYPDYPWSKSTGSGRLAEWSRQFDTAAQQLRDAGIKVFFYAQSAAVKCFQRLDKAALEAACVP